MQDRMEETRLHEASIEEGKRLTAEERSRLLERSKELVRYKRVIDAQEKELDAYRSKLKDEQLQREKEFQRELDARDKFFTEREKKLFERQRDFENHLMQRQAENENMRAHLENEISAREAKLQQATIELQQEKERYNEESRKKIERTSKDYVSDALESLDKKERQFHLISKVWSWIGAGALITGLMFFGWVTVNSITSLPTIITWEIIAFSVFKGIIALTLIAGLAKYAFSFSSSYMREALKNADRRHAINFGKFYLESFGAAAEWAQVKEAFEHWNITGSNAFTPQKQDGGIDVTALEKAVTLIERVGKSLPKAKSSNAD
jgi:hypothetical protein